MPFSHPAQFARDVPNGRSLVLNDSLGQIPALQDNRIFASNRVFDTFYALSGGVGGLNYVVGTLPVVGTVMDVSARIAGAEGLLHISFTDLESEALLPQHADYNLGPFFLPDGPTDPLTLGTLNLMLRRLPIPARFMQVWIENLGAVATTSWYQTVIIYGGG